MISQAPKKLKLFIVRPTLGQGGADRVTVNLLQVLDRNLFDLSLVLMRAEGEFLSDTPDDVKIYPLNASSLWTTWLPLTRLLHAEKPDILFSTCSGANIPAVIAHRLSRRTGRLVLSERNVLFHGKLSIKRIFVNLLKWVLYRWADQITAVSQGVKDDLITKLGISPERISVVYNPVVTEGIQRLAAEPVEHPWFQEGIPIILGAGRLIFQKDFPTLIRAFVRVRAERHVRLAILGEGPLKNDLLALVRSRGLESDVWFAGFDKNPFKYMAKCTMFVLASKDEGLPGVLIQAMACGAPVISTDCHAGPSEIIRPDVDGFLVPVGDVASMAEKIRFLLDHPEIRQQMGDMARQSVQRFKVDVVLNNYVTSLL
jgi:glycosyltransferase involved in cell wall biosynthesis